MIDHEHSAAVAHRTDGDAHGGCESDDLIDRPVGGVGAYLGPQLFAGSHASVGEHHVRGRELGGADQVAEIGVLLARDRTEPHKTVRSWFDRRDLERATERSPRLEGGEDLTEHLERQHHRLELRDVDVYPSSGVAGQVQRGERGGRSECTNREISECPTCGDRFGSGQSAVIERPDLCLQCELVGRSRGPWSTATERRDRQQRRGGILRVQYLDAESECLDGSRREVLDDEVGSGAHGPHHRPALFGLQVGDDTLL